jgi:hypothetical protein
MAGPQAAGRDLLVSLKAEARWPRPRVVLPVGEPPVAVLRPVPTRPDRLNADDIRRLTEWRNRFVGAFLTEFEATEARTGRWLTEEVGPADDRILFMLDDVAGRTFGHMGLCAIDWRKSRAEADAVVRGADAPAGVMRRALVTLLMWARQSLGLSHLCVRVRSDNGAVAFYRKAGFVERRRVGLRRLVEPGMVRWVEDATLPDAEVMLIHMTWQG